jgi:hypothetical protein
MTHITTIKGAPTICPMANKLKWVFLNLNDNKMKMKTMDPTIPVIPARELGRYTPLTDPEALMMCDTIWNHGIRKKNHGESNKN